jgi:HD-like signal output (HDOD) protein
MRIIELVSDQNSSVADFTETIRSDQALTGRLLRMANSAAYGQRTPVTKIERAMVLIGIEKLKALALGFHLSKVAFAEDDFSFQRVWTKSLFRGWLASRLAERLGSEASGEAFIVGLLSDAGLPMMPKLIGAGYANTVDPKDPPAKQYLTESSSLPYTHVDVAAALCRLWKLPDVLSKPITNHHTPPSGLDPKSPASVLQATGYFVGMLPLDPQGRACFTQPVAATARRLFDMTSEDVGTLLDLAAEDFEKCKAVFSHIIDQHLGVEAIVEQANRHLGSIDGPELEDDEEPAEVLRFHAGDMFIEIEPSDEHHVTVFLTDAAGNRILSEQIDPSAHDERSIRQALLLENAPSEQVAQVLQGLASLGQGKLAA